MSGWLRVVGLGPGPDKWLTPEAHDVLHAATDIVGYIPYVERVPATARAKRHASDNRVELERAQQALQAAACGARVAVVSGGDAGVFGMAAALFEAMEKGDAAWRVLDVAVVPGMTALLAAAARVGAPLGHDFCVISLSDQRKPWSVIQLRLKAACEGDFVLAVYNPASSTRREQLEAALAQLRVARGADTVAVAATSVGCKDERVMVTTLGALDAAQVNMRTLLIIGSTKTRAVGRFVYTPRTYAEAL